MEDYLEIEPSPLSVLSESSNAPRNFQNEAKQISPDRAKILAKRDALINAYKTLIQAQSQKELPIRNLPEWSGSVYALASSNNPNDRMIAAGDIGKLQTMLKERELLENSQRNQAKTALEMSAQDLGFLEKDQAARMDLLKQASLDDYRSDQEKIRLMMLMNKMKPDSTLTPDPANAPALGVPVYSGPNPYEGLDRTGQRQLRMNFEKDLEKIQDEADKGSEDIQDIERFLQLNESVKNDKLGTGRGTGWLKTFTDADFQEMDSISSRLVPKMREPGSGSSSDLDVKMFRAGMIGVNKLYEANKNIGTALLISRKLKQEKSQFMENYLSANGHLRGANQAWKRYLNDNPIFDPIADTKTFKLNENRMSWQDYFSGGDIMSSETKTRKTKSQKPEYYEYMTPEEKALFDSEE
jgi:hypothetical protein